MSRTKHVPESHQGTLTSATATMTPPPPPDPDLDPTFPPNRSILDHVEVDWADTGDDDVDDTDVGS